jgi:hypothetical protein
MLYPGMPGLVDKHMAHQLRPEKEKTLHIRLNK